MALITLKELTQLTDDTNTPPTTVSTTTVNAVLNEASSMVDSYCRTRYQVPLQASDDATRITRDIALWLLYSRRPQKMPEGAQARYDAGMLMLKDISTGKASLDQQAGSPSPQVVAGGPVVAHNREERFTDRNLEGFA